MARREREILEHAVHAATKQAAKADDLVDEAYHMLTIRDRKEAA